METPDATRANSALWQHYIEQQWDLLLTPFGGVAAAALAGAAMANFYGAIYGDLIGRLFASNASEVTRFVQQSDADVLPTWPAMPLPPESHDTVPPWLRVAFEDEHAPTVNEADRELALAR